MPAANLSPKEAFCLLVESLPDDCSWEDFLRRFKSVRSAHDALCETVEGRVCTLEQLLKRLPWLRSGINESS